MEMGNGDVGHQGQHSIPAGQRGQDLLGTGAMHQLERETHGYFSCHASTNELAAQSCTILEQGVSCVFKGLFAFVPSISDSRQAGFK